MGYDIRDYRKMMTKFDRIEDFNTLLAGLKQRHMRLIIDLVVNHTSDENRWFIKFHSGKTNPYRDFYIWRSGSPAPDGTRTPPNNYRLLLWFRVDAESKDERVLPPLICGKATRPQLGKPEKQ